MKFSKDVKQIKDDDYNEYSNIETLEIPLNIEVDIDFFKNLIFIRIVNFDLFF